jgi:hypothetical protein
LLLLSDNPVTRRFVADAISNWRLHRYHERKCRAARASFLGKVGTVLLDQEMVIRSGKAMMVCVGTQRQPE